MTRIASGRASLRALMGADRWREAILMASAFHRLPAAARGRILSAREAYLRPDFQRALGRSPDQLIAEGKVALIECYQEVQVRA